MLPIEKEIKNLHNYFPTDWQAVIFRNYGLVPAEKIAKVLKTSANIIIMEAERLGLAKITYNPDWLIKGYITIIRNNWHIISYSQIMELLSLSTAQLDYLLKEDDFLSVKLGDFKPLIKEPVFIPLSEEETDKTKKIKVLVESNYIQPQIEPFDFYSYNSGYDNFKVDSDCKIQERIIYSYSALYGDCLLDETIDSYPEILLQKLSDCGVNAIWMQGLLSKLEFYPFDKSLCFGYETRQKNLNKVIEKCGKYGIKIYLYLNEPRSIEEKYFDDKQELKGHTADGYCTLCTGNKTTKEYLYNAVKNLVQKVPKLGGIITITMSENLTNCYCKGQTNCLHCKNKKAEETVAEINNIMYRAIRDSKSNVRFIANLWGWSQYMGWTPAMTRNGIEHLEKGIEVLCISENAMKINKGGIDNTIVDYSISNIGPSEETINNLKYAKDLGHKIIAKVQINNSWECSAVPFIPVFDLISKHMENLQELSIDGIMLSWTLGGYPSMSLNLVKRYYSGEKVNLNKWYEETFKENVFKVKNAVKLFSAGFEKLPFDINFLYFCTQNIGCGNIWYEKNTNLKASMVGFPYDDIDCWRGKYPREVFAGQLQDLTDDWEDGIKILESIENIKGNTKEVLLVAKVVYIHFYSTLLQFKYNEIKEQKDNEEVKQDLLKKELKLVKELYKIISTDARIGFEASNHYYYNENSLIEKIICLKYLIKV